MKNLFGLFDDSVNETKNEEDGKKIVEGDKLVLRKEELDVSKNRVETGNVKLSKEVIEEQKVINVPVMHEEIIIERKAIDNEPTESSIDDEDEILSMAVSEEQVQVGKHTVITGEIFARKNEVEENREIKETLKREEARVNKDGNANVVDDIDQLH